MERTLATWDEQIYFNAAQNVLDGHWLLPRFALESHPLPVLDPFLHKPPLVYWIQAAAMALGGETPSVARWPSIVAMSGVVGLTVLLTWRLSGLFGAAIAGWVGLQIPALGGTRAANHVATDPFLLLFGFGAVYCLVRFVETENNRWAWLSGVGYGLAIMAKSVAAAPFGLFALPYLYRYRRSVGWAGFGRVIAGGLIVAAPWFLLAAGLAFEELLDQMVLRQVVGRATGERFVENEGMFEFMRYPYFVTADDYFGWPYFALWLAGVVSFGRWWLTDRYRDLDVLMWPLGIGVIVLYALIGGNHQWYIMPAAVPIAVLVGDAVATSLKLIGDGVGTVVVLRSGPD
ncbi:MAG: glycosyltransferase family 39 protein [Halovenus sp.]